MFGLPNIVRDNRRASVRWSTLSLEQWPRSSPRTSGAQAIPRGNAVEPSTVWRRPLFRVDAAFDVGYFGRMPAPTP